RRPDRDYSSRIDRAVALVIVALDMLHVDCAGDTGELVQLAGEGPDVRVFDDPAAVALEVAVIDLVEADERGEQADVGFSELVSGKITALRKKLLDPVERVEHARDRLLIGRLARSKPRLVDAVVAPVVNARVHRIDLGSKRLRIIIAWLRAHFVERAAQHPD